MVDAALAAEFGFQRLNRDAVGLHRTIAAAFAHRRIDEDAAGRIDQLLALAAAALFGGAGLIEDDHRAARRGGEFLGDVFQFAAIEQAHGGRDGDTLVAIEILGEDHHLLGMFGQHLRRDLVHAQFAVMLLPAGHGDGVVVEDLVGDVHTRRDRLADGEQAGVEIGAVAQIGEDVLFADERRFAHPGHAFAAHLGEGFGAVHPQRHDVAADAGERALAFRRLGGGVVWAAGAEIGAALDRRDVRGGFAGLIAEEGECAADPVGVVKMLQARGDHMGDDAG